jgi:hypothetical protein
MTTQTQPKAKKIATKASKASLQLNGEMVEQPIQEVAKALQRAGQPQYGAIQYVTSLNLMRRMVNDHKKVVLYLPDDTYKDLVVIGIKLGVTWDEALRGIIDMHLASADPVSGLKLFVPALS